MNKEEHDNYTLKWLNPIADKKYLSQKYSEYKKENGKHNTEN
jgi:hypothetical protein